MKKINTLFLIIPFLVFAQRERPKNKNIFHTPAFWQSKPNIAKVKQKIKGGHDAVKANSAAFDAISFAIMAKAPLETIKFLLSLPGNEVNKPTHDARSYLMWAGYTGDLAVMKLLLSKGANTKVVGSHGFNWYTFTLNAGNQNTAIYDLMVANGVDLKETNRAGANAILLLAPYSKDGKIIDYFQKRGVPVNAIDKNGNDILFYAAQRGNIDLIKKYITKGFDPKKINTDGENLVLVASHGARRYTNSIEVYKYLKSIGLSLNLINTKGQTALHLVSKSTKDIKIIDFFIKNGVDVYKKDNGGNTAFLNAVKGNNQKVVDKLIGGVKNINLKNNDGFTALTFATQGINNSFFEVLKAKGADVNIVDLKGNNLFYHLFNAYGRRNSKYFDVYANALQTAGVSFKQASITQPPLHIAIAKENSKLIKKAFELGADINQKNKEGLTPLHLAAMKSSEVYVLKRLLKIGADKTVLTEFGETAYDLAKENELLKNKEISFLKPE